MNIAYILFWNTKLTEYLEQMHMFAQKFNKSALKISSYLEKQNIKQINIPVTSDYFPVTG